MMSSKDTEVSCTDSPRTGLCQRVRLRRAAHNRLSGTRAMLDDESVSGPPICVPNRDLRDLDKPTNPQKAASNSQDNIAHRKSSPQVLSDCRSSSMMVRGRNVDRRLDIR